MEEYLGMQSMSAPNFERKDDLSGQQGGRSLPFEPVQSPGVAQGEQAPSDLQSSILQSLVYWERIFAYQEGVKPQRTNGDTECTQAAEPGADVQPISE